MQAFPVGTADSITGRSVEIEEPGMLSCLLQPDSADAAKAASMTDVKKSSTCTKETDVHPNFASLMLTNFRILTCFGILEEAWAVINDPHRVAMDFLTGLANGSFAPGSYFTGLPRGGPLTLGHCWDNRFLTLFSVDIDNRVVQAVHSRMARYAGVMPVRLALSETNIDSLWHQPECQTNAITFGILCNGVQDGSLQLRKGHYSIWGRYNGWRIWELTP